MDRCESRSDRTGGFTCRRCGYVWDRDDTAPDCKTDEQLETERHAGEMQRGRKAIDRLREIVRK